MAQWIKERDARDALVLDEEVDGDIFNRVLDEAYAADLTDTETQQAGRDPFLIAYAMMNGDRCIVTKEVSKPTKTRGRRKLPDACDILNIRWMNDFRFYQERNFRIR